MAQEECEPGDEHRADWLDVLIAALAAIVYFGTPFVLFMLV